MNIINLTSEFCKRCVAGRQLRLLSASERKRLPAAIADLYKTAIRKRAQRQKVKPTNAPTHRIKAIVPLGNEDQALALRLAKEAFPRRKNWSEPKASTSTSVQSLNHGRYSSRCFYTRWTYVPLLKSVATFSQGTGKAVLYTHHAATHFIKAPRGWSWTTDEVGLCLISRTSSDEDYHPDSDDLRKGSRHVLKQAVALRRKRREQAARERKEKTLLLRHARGVRVGLQDSLAAGNCKTGNTEFARRHGLDPEGYYAPRMLLALEPDNPRVKLAIAVATRRHLNAKGGKAVYKRMRSPLTGKMIMKLVSPYLQG